MSCGIKKNKSGIKQRVIKINLKYFSNCLLTMGIQLALAAIMFASQQSAVQGHIAFQATVFNEGRPRRPLPL